MCTFLISPFSPVLISILNLLISPPMLYVLQEGYRNLSKSLSIVQATQRHTRTHSLSLSVSNRAWHRLNIQLSEWIQWMVEKSKEITNEMNLIEIKIKEACREFLSWARRFAVLVVLWGQRWSFIILWIEKLKWMSFLS